MKWALVGCGVIGERRIQALPPGVKLSACFDPNQERAKKVAALTGAQVCSDLNELLSQRPDAIIVASINSAIVPAIQAAIDQKIPVLAEKPAARSFDEISSVKNPHNIPIKIGFNHRFHPAFRDLQKILQSDSSDPIMFIRAQYGNGARLGFDREWRSQVALSGGGELLDQGVHLLDLAGCLLPNMDVNCSQVRTLFWDMPVDDNAWAILETPLRQTFSMHVSATEWKNDFRFEVYTKKKKLQWLGLGRSYGPEKLNIYTMTPEMGPPLFEERSYANEDLSWLNENINFQNAMLGREALDGDHQDAKNALRLVEKIYRLSKEKSPDRHPQWWTNSGI